MDDAPVLPEPKVKVLFLHIPKTAGTTLRIRLARFFNHQHVLDIWNRRIGDVSPDDLENCRLLMGHFAFEDVADLFGQYFTLCFLREPRDRLISTYRFWRAHRWEVVERTGWPWLSKAKRMPMHQFFLDPEIRNMEDVNNTIVRYLTRRRYGAAPPIFIDDAVVEEAKQNLMRFSHVGLLDTYDADVAHLERVAGREIPGGKLRVKQVPLDDGNADLETVVMDDVDWKAFDDAIKELIVHDHVVYDFALSHRASITAPVGELGW
jgi:hypothetical protein